MNTGKDRVMRVNTLICVSILILLLDYELVKNHKNPCGVGFHVNISDSLNYEAAGKNESTFFDSRKTQLHCLQLVRKATDMGCKKPDCVWLEVRKVGSFLSVSFRSQIPGAFVKNTENTFSSTYDWLRCLTKIDSSGKSGFPHENDAIVSSIQKWINVIIFLVVFAKYWKRRSLMKCEESLSKHTQKGSIFGFAQSRFHCNFIAYPSTLDQYFEDAKKGTKETLMNYEWIRYGSFKTYPEKSVASPMRLAKSGFYYSGDGEEVTCFSCGLKNRHWSNRESVRHTHKRLSPNCPLVNGTDTANVPIHPGQSDENENDTQTVQTPGGACGGPLDGASDLASHEKPRTETEHTSNSNDTANNEEHEQKSPMMTRKGFTYKNGSIERFPGIFREKPKFPDYAIKSQRLSTFSKWSSSHPVTPAALAESGFFFTGPGDAVRCFFCGGGMRSWQNGDHPWIEHARWFPNCGYVRQFKGDNFVNMCRAAHLDTDLYQQISEIRNEADENDVVSDTLIEDLNSAAAKAVLEMGYTQERVEQAIQQHRRRQGTTELRVQHLLEYLLDNTYTPSPHQAPSNNTNDHNKSSNSLQKSKDSSATANKDDDNLAAENERLREKMLCKICFEGDANIVFLPCGHMVACVECAHVLRKCAVCRKLIEGRIRTFLS